MAIRKVVKNLITDTPTTQAERVAEAYIERAGQQPQPQVEPEKPGKHAVTLHFDRAFLKRIDIAAKRKQIKRAAWIYAALSEAVESDENR